mmetsp:Transcript_20319/g.50732  ORF Transcript_20319/g.50732 Transcript_20319/m.50732 type:complete len:82 (+) Transcript_20319:190-435(+)
MALRAPPQPVRNRVESARSNRSRCRRCRHAIARGELRLTTVAWVKNARWTTFHRCASCARTHAAAVAAADPSADLTALLSS